VPERSVHSSQVAPVGAEIPQIGELVAGKYRIEGTLGVGGMGVVLAARHETIGQAVAIKFLVVNDEEYLSEATQRLLREARAAAQLRGEHIVRVYDVGELSNGTPFIVMERLEGSDLGEISTRLGKLPIPVAVAFVIQAARAISEAHGAGIVHRDLKPSNLFIVRQPDGKALLKVVDFGISKSLRTEAAEVQPLTGARVALGSPHYMSPEQVRDARRVDARTDIWALGVILYELIAGRPAFHADSYPGIFAAITADPVPPLGSLRPEIAAGLERIIARCLERDPAVRFQRAEELLLALQDYSAHELKYDQLFTPDAPLELAASPNTLRAGESASSSGQRPASSKQANENESTFAFTQTKLSAGSDQVARERVEQAEPSGRSQEVPAIANSARGESGAPHTRRSLATDQAQAEVSGTRGRQVGIALGAAVFALLLLWQLGQRQAIRATPAPAPSASAVRVAPALLTIESNPPGAQVSEGERSYGPTPLRLSLTNEGGPERPRTFVLSLPGYRTHVFERAPSPDATFVRIDLVRESEAPASPPVPDPRTPPAASAVAPTGLPHARPPRVVSSSKPVEAGPDIRLVR